MRMAEPGEMQISQSTSKALSTIFGQRGIAFQVASHEKSPTVARRPGFHCFSQG